MNPLLLHLLRVVSLPHWAEHRVRTALTVLGVALGVATIVAVADINRSVSASFERAIEAVAGTSALEVTSTTGSIDESLVATVAATPGVKAAAGLVEAFVGLADHPEETLYLLGMNFLGASVWQEQLPRAAIDIPDELVFISQPDSVMVGRQFAERYGLSDGAALRAVVPSGVQMLRVRGQLGDVPAASLFGGALGVMDLPAAQRLLGREAQVDRIAIEPEPGADVESVRRRIATLLGPGLEVAAPEARGAGADKLLVSLRGMLTTAGSFAVIVGALLVYQAVMVSVQQRRRQFALLDAVGIERTTLMRLCLVETAALAIVGVALGIPAGWALSSLASGIVGSATSEIWFRVHVAHAARSPAGVVVGAVAGLVMALAAAYLAARNTFSSPTVEALRPSAVESEPRGRGGTVAVGAVLVAATWSILLIRPTQRWLIVGSLIVAQVAAYWGWALLGPALVSAVGAAWQRAVRGSRWLPVRLAADGFPSSPRRTGITVAAIGAAVGMSVSMTGLVRSFDAAWSHWIREHFAADVFVGSGARFRLLAGPPMGPEVRAALSAIPGVAVVEPFRVVLTQVGDRPVFLQGIALDTRVQHGGLAMVEGDLDTAAPALRDGSGVLLSDNLAFRMGLHQGDRLMVPTPAGAREFRVEGTFVDYLGSLDLGSVMVAEEQLETVWNDRTANLFRLWLAPGASAATVRGMVRSRLGPGYFAVTAREFLGAVQSVLQQFFVASWVLVLVAPLVGVIGVVNSQLATIVDRWTDIGMLRTIGVSRGDLSRAVLLECGVTGLLGGLCGLVLGIMLFAQFTFVTLRLLTGWSIPIVMPVGPLIVGVVCAGLIAAAAGWLPARVAARIEGRQQSFD